MVPIPSPAYHIFNLGGSSMLVRDFAKFIQLQATSLFGEKPSLDIPASNSPFKSKILSTVAAVLLIT